MAPSQLTLTPRVSEQSFEFAAKDVYVFIVPMTATKQDIKNAVQQQYDVTVTGVNTGVHKGKKKASNRKRQRPIDGKRVDVKKAYVTLKKGDTITVFEDGN